MIVKLGSRPWTLGAILLTAGVLVAGCGSNATSPSGSRGGEGTLAVGLRAATSQESAPLASPTALGGDGGMTGGSVAIESLALTIDKIRIYPAEHDSSDSGDRFGEFHGDGDSDGDSASVPLEFAVPDKRIEMSTLGDSLTVLLASFALPEGKYTHVSLHMTQAEAVLAGGTTVEVHVARPDDFLMVQVPFTVSGGVLTPIVLVVDLAHSVHEVPPGSGNYVLRPVVWGEMGHGESEWQRGDDGAHHWDGGMPH